MWCWSDCSWPPLALAHSGSSSQKWQITEKNTHTHTHAPTHQGQQHTVPHKRFAVSINEDDENQSLFKIPLNRGRLCSSTVTLCGFLFFPWINVLIHSQVEERAIKSTKLNHVYAHKSTHTIESLRVLLRTVYNDVWSSDKTLSPRSHHQYQHLQRQVLWLTFKIPTKENNPGSHKPTVITWR